jgi:hypothetical protein
VFYVRAGVLIPTSTMLTTASVGRRRFEHGAGSYAIMPPSTSSCSIYRSSLFLVAVLRTSTRSTQGVFDVKMGVLIPTATMLTLASVGRRRFEHGAGSYAIMPPSTSSSKALRTKPARSTKV